MGFWELTPSWVWLLVPVVGALTALGLVLPARWFPRYVGGLCAVGVLLWAQGNLLLADYGLLDGGGLDLTSHAWRTPLEAGLWVGVFVLAVAFANVVARVAPVACVALMMLQATVLVVPVGRMATADAPSTPGAETAWRLPPPEIYELSSTRNLIHIVLDTFPTHTFAGILDADRPAFNRDWPGFTFFANHLGAHRTTLGAMPAMLSGVAFRNEMPFREFVARHPSVFHVLGQQGYRLRSLASRGHDHLNPSFPGVDAAIRYDIPTPYGSYRDYVDVAAAQLLDLSLFRHAPHAFKPDIYRDRQWLLQQRIAARRGPEATAAQPFGDAAFLRDFANRITRGDDAPVYTFLHVITPHLPVVTDADCAYAPKSAPIPEGLRGPGTVRLVSGRDAAPTTAGSRPLRPKRHHRHLRPWTDPGSDQARRSASVGRTIAGRADPPKDRVLGHSSAARQAVCCSRSIADLVRTHRDYRRARHATRPRRPPRRVGTWRLRLADRSGRAAAAYVCAP